MAWKKWTKFVPSDREFWVRLSCIEEYMECPRCFYEYRRHGYKRPSVGSSQLPNVADRLLKMEFDGYRARQEPHPLMAGLPGDLVPFAHEEIDTWRNNFEGVAVPVPEAGFVVTGAVDDVWLDRSTETLHVVDYKTSTQESVAALLEEYGPKYSRQLAIYQWLLRERGFRVSDVGYLLVAFPDPASTDFGDVMHFTSEIVPITGESDWVHARVLEARACLEQDTAPSPTEGCKWCTWAKNVTAG